MLQNQIEIIASGNGTNLPGLVNSLQNQLPKQIIQNKSQNTILFIFEQHYFRIESNLSTIVFLDYYEIDKCNITITSSGGKQGLCGFDYGAEKNYRNKIYQYICDFASENQMAIIPVKETNDDAW